MAAKKDFDEQSWKILRETPQLVGTAMMMAGASGLGTIKESFAIGQGLMEGQASATPLIRQLNLREEILAAQASVKEWVQKGDAGDIKTRVRVEAIDKCRAAITVLQAHGSQEDLAAFRDWVYALAEGVAKAACEGGVLGFGGVRISPEEQSLLDDLKAAMNP